MNIPLFTDSIFEQVTQIELIFAMVRLGTVLKNHLIRGVVKRKGKNIVKYQ